MKALYIVGVVLSVIFLFVIGFFVAEVESARYMSYYDYDYSSYNSYSYQDNGSDDTMMAAIVSFFFFTFFIMSAILGLIKVKTKTNKVFSIIGLSISGIFFLWNLLVMIDPGALSFDEVGVGFAFYSLIMLAFMIVGLVQAVKYAKSKRVDTNSVISTAILDS
ncbi:MAG: hypothetical protein HRT58_17025 [Crocinitomicaceae bacterium]|nr:hypothetical protein [Flavobacteriales bacterium]NQZ37372.1 hypothetical protein [Crocinitomicaceae bacterium]